MNAETARDRMVVFVRQTMATAGGDWTARSNGPASSGCTTPDGDPGVTFSWDQERSGAEDPEALVRTVASTWQEKDHDVTFRQDQIDDGRPLWSAVTTGKAVESISVNASPRRVSIHVQSACGTGDLDDFERRAGARLALQATPHRTGGAVRARPAPPVRPAVTATARRSRPSRPA